MEKIKHVLVIGTITILMVLEAVFLANGFQEMETDYVNEYLEQEKQCVEQVNLHLKYLLEQGEQQQGLVGYMSENAPVSGSYYMWLMKSDTVIFAKNETVTASLGEMQEKEAFLESVKQQDVCYISEEFSYNETNYVTGMVIDRNYILENEGLEELKMYHGLSLFIVALFMFSVLIVYIQAFWRENTKRVRLVQVLEEKNKAVDEMYEKIVKLTQEIENQKQNPNRKVGYDSEMARKLLKKSGRADLQPAYYAAIQVQMDEGQYYERKQVREIAKKIPLDRRHVQMELKKGVFLVFFYRTGKSEVEDILKESEKNWKAAELEIDVHTGAISLDDTDRAWLEDFLEGKEA